MNCGIFKNIFCKSKLGCCNATNGFVLELEVGSTYSSASASRSASVSGKNRLPTAEVSAASSATSASSTTSLTSTTP